MNTAFLIFPNQLYEDVSLIKAIKPKHIFIIEEPIYFFDPQHKHFKPHQIKIAYLRACMKAYFVSQLKKQFPKKCTYINYNDMILDSQYKFLKHYNQISFYDPLDIELVAKMKNVMNGNVGINIIESPDLLLKKDILDEYYKDETKIPKHASFYEFVKSKLNVLQGVKNLDTMNRSPPPKTEPHVYQFSPSKSTIKYYKEAIQYTQEEFTSHNGNCDLLQTYPITSKDAKKAFDHFLSRSLENFGKYEDAVMQDDPFMYHSVISPMLNIGILSPSYILETTIEFYDNNKNYIPLSSLEGFIRQVIGWRFFMQSLYIYKHNDLINSNHPENHLTFRNTKDWYEGTTGIKPLDEEIRKVQKYGYSHHIVRLMMFMNFFILCNVHPHEIYRWFMEVVSLDAYSWVMISNIYAMGYFYPKVMSKPYISSSNYIVKMTNYKKDGHWDKVWDALYHNFLKEKKTSYTFFYKRTYKDDPKMHKLAQEFKNTFFVEYKHK
jgi:deoxyribodipyrimidine photolyase-related protein